MVIPDANSTVRRFQLSAVILVISVAVLVALIASSITALLLYRGNTSQIGQLKQQLSKATGDYENIIEEKQSHRRVANRSRRSVGASQKNQFEHERHQKPGIGAQRNGRHRNRWFRQSQIG